MILIGSRALAIRFPTALSRKPVDFDFVCTLIEQQEWMEKNRSKINPIKEYSVDNKMIVEGDVNCEFEIIKPNSSAELLASIVDSEEKLETPFGLVPSFDMLFTIKNSHRYKKNSPFFWKTFSDWHRMRLYGAKVRDEYKEFLRLREKETYTNALPKLNVSKDKFFDGDDVKYVWEHDDIHKAVAINEQPAYTHYLKDGEQVLTDRSKFFSCSQHIRVSGAYEEAAVLAVERSLVPFPGKLTDERAWRYAYSKVCSSITGGYFRQFAYENGLEVLKMYDANKDYYQRFLKAVEDNKVRKLGANND